MGWDFTRGATRAEIIARRTRIWETDTHAGQTIAHQCSGNTLWTVNVLHDKATNTSKRFIGCDLLAAERGYGWGYKDMEESSHPYYYTCPLLFLEMAPVACQEWRDKVRAEHAKRNQKLYIGQEIALENCTVKTVRIASVRPLRGYDANGKLWAIPKRYLPAQA